jgi:hypothetical protein
MAERKGDQSKESDEVRMKWDNTTPVSRLELRASFLRYFGNELNIRRLLESVPEEAFPVFKSAVWTLLDAQSVSRSDLLSQNINPLQAQRTAASIKSSLMATKYSAILRTKRALRKASEGS